MSERKTIVHEWFKGREWVEDCTCNGDDVGTCWYHLTPHEKTAEREKSLLDLLGEIDREAAPEITEAMVERAARVMYRLMPFGGDWNKMLKTNPDTAAHWREHARAALRAALTQEGE